MDNIGWKDLELSSEAIKALQELQPEQLMAVRMRHVKNGKVQIEFAQKIDSPNPVRSALGMLNQSDPRFNTSTGARRSWETAHPGDVKSLFGFEIPEGESSVEILKLVPNVNGQTFALQIIEITETEWKERNAARSTPEDEAYLENKLKRAGAEGNFFYTPQGERVVSEPRLVHAPIGTKIENVYLDGSYTTAEQAMKQSVGTPTQTPGISAVL